VLDDERWEASVRVNNQHPIIERIEVPRHVLAQANTPWLQGDLSAEVINLLGFRHVDPGGLFHMTQEALGSPTSNCVLSGNVIGVGSWDSIAPETQMASLGERSGAFLATAMLYLTFRGQHSLSVLQQLTPRTVHDMQPGDVRFVVFTTPYGGIDDEAVVLCKATDELHMSIGGGKAPTWLDSIDMAGVEVTEELVSFNIKGPDRMRAMLTLLHPESCENVRALEPLHCTEVVTRSGEPAITVRTVIGYELWAEPAVLSRAWGQLLSQPELVTPCGWDALNAYRLQCQEIPFLLYPLDMHAGTMPHEIGLSWMARDVKREFVGHSAFADGIPAARFNLRGIVGLGSDSDLEIGDHVTSLDGELCGHVTSTAPRTHRVGNRAFALILPSVSIGDSVVVRGARFRVTKIPIPLG